MDISTLSGVTGYGKDAAAGPANKTVGKDEFLRLFVTQLQHQDPLSPMDSAGFTAQLAQFSSLEQLTNISEQMNNLVLYQNSLQNAMAPGLIGRRVGVPPKDASGNEIPGAPLSFAVVTGIAFEDNRTWLVLDGGAKIAPGDIREIR